MTPQENLFVNQPDQLKFDETKNYLEELVGDGKKFKDAESLAKGKAEADAFIAFKNKEYDTLKEDYLRLREEHQAGSRLQDLIDRLSNQQNQSTSSEENTQIANEDEKAPAIKLEDIDTRVSNKIAQIELQRKETDNFNEVRAKLQERFGSNYENVLKQHVNDLGLSDEDVNALAKKSPKAFFKAIGLDNAPADNSFNTPPRSNQRSDNFSPVATNKRTWSYYENLRKNSPKIYLDPKTQVQMHKDAAELGDKFEDGDFKY